VSGRVERLRHALAAVLRGVGCWLRLAGAWRGGRVHRLQGLWCAPRSAGVDTGAPGGEAASARHQMIARAYSATDGYSRTNRSMGVSNGRGTLYTGAACIFPPVVSGFWGGRYESAHSVGFEAG